MILFPHINTTDGKWTEFATQAWFMLHSSIKRSTVPKHHCLLRALRVNFCNLFCPVAKSGSSLYSSRLKSFVFSFIRKGLQCGRFKKMPVMWRSMRRWRMRWGKSIDWATIWHPIDQIDGCWRKRLFLPRFSDRMWSIWWFWIHPDTFITH